MRGYNLYDDYNFRDLFKKRGCFVSAMRGDPHFRLHDSRAGDRASLTATLSLLLRVQANIQMCSLSCTIFTPLTFYRRPGRYGRELATFSESTRPHCSGEGRACRRPNTQSIQASNSEINTDCCMYRLATLQRTLLNLRCGGTEGARITVTAT